MRRGRWISIWMMRKIRRDGFMEVGGGGRCWVGVGEGGMSLWVERKSGWRERGWGIMLGENSWVSRIKSCGIGYEMLKGDVCCYEILFVLPVLYKPLLRLMETDERVVRKCASLSWCCCASSSRILDSNIRVPRIVSACMMQLGKSLA